MTFVVNAGFVPTGYSPIGFAPSFVTPWGGPVPPQVLALLQQPMPGLPPHIAQFLALHPNHLPAHVSAGNLAATNPFAQLSAIDPRTAAYLQRQLGGAAGPILDRGPTPAQIAENNRQTYGSGAPSLIQRSENAIALSQLAFLAAMNGGKVNDLQQILGGDKKEARKLAKSIKLLADRIQQQPQNPEKIARAALQAHWNMIPFVANNKAEQKLGEQIFQNIHGVSHPEKAKFNFQGPLGNMVQGAAPGAGATQDGQFRTGNPSQAGQNALQAAISQIGVREASGNNDGVPSQRYMDGRREPWCANFVSWAFRQAGHPLPGNQRSLASCDYMAGQFKQRGKFMPRGSGQPKPGDVIFFGRPGDYTHVGIVERVANGRVYTVEGNTSDQVARRSYALGDSYVQGYGIT